MDVLTTYSWAYNAAYSLFNWPYEGCPVKSRVMSPAMLYVVPKSHEFSGKQQPEAPAIVPLQNLMGAKYPNN